MATTTTNYGLKKPESTDLVSVTPFNDNFDTLDAALSGLKFRVLTQSQYDAISSKDSKTLYFIKES